MADFYYDYSGEQEQGGSYYLGPPEEQCDLTPEEIELFLDWTVDFIDLLIDNHEDRQAFGYNISMQLERNRPRTPWPGMW